MGEARRRGRGRRIVVVMLAVVVVALGAWLATLADVRPEGLRAADPSAAASGRALLEHVAKTHGIDARRQRHVMDVVFRDAWSIAPVRPLIAPWGQPEQRVRGRWLTRSWTTEFELLGGERDGERYGLQSWQAWSAEPGKPAVFEPDWITETLLPGTRYFIEFPFSLLSASVVVDAGQADYNGKTYDRVFVSWESAEPQSEFDQYLLWIDTETGKLALVDFTIRVLLRAAQARAFFGGLRNVDGILIPTQIIIVAVLPGGLLVPVHEIEVEEVQWDTVTPEVLKPNSQLVDRGEHKPR